MDPINEIKKAAKGRVLVQIQYKDSKGNVTTRLTEPYELRDDSYFGYDTEKDSIRNFKINQIISAVATKISFVAKWPIQII